MLLSSTPLHQRGSHGGERTQRSKVYQFGPRSLYVALSIITDPLENMTSLPELIPPSCVDVHQTILSHNGTEYLCFSRLAGSDWLIGLSNGDEYWERRLTYADFLAHRDEAQRNDPLAQRTPLYFQRFTHALSLCKAHVANDPKGGVTVHIDNNSTKPLVYKLEEGSQAAKKAAMRYVMFVLLRKAAEGKTSQGTGANESILEQLQTELRQTKAELKRLKDENVKLVTTSSNNDLSQMAQPSPKKKRIEPKKQAAKSLVNPGMRKMKRKQLSYVDDVEESGD
eukprot:comp169512_c0_seq1/m.49534 comp169512_c0_seq1/g.49534  ORF comp169512_c0_seq1/g.49534 comp169512_c0_seq1/m.49534 type:complete len:282 (-) comp169512_c0_seq1:128-973(-)